MYVLNDDDDVKTQVATTCYDDVNTQVLNDDGGGPGSSSGVEEEAACVGDDDNDKEGVLSSRLRSRPPTTVLFNFTRVL